jgi:peptidoglycan/LPS O-acetylase OafA/YrhL
MSSSERSGFRPDIEGLRGLAVLIVVLFHCGAPWFSGGFIGVDVFFVLSGYLITGLLIAEIDKKASLSLLQFYARRMRRLLPACAVTLIVTMLLSVLILAPNETKFAGRAARATALYLSNVFFGINAADYFGSDVETNPMLHTWSLAVEEQFYMCWPLLIMLGIQKLRSMKALAIILSGLTVASLFISIWATAHGGTFAFYQLPARAWEFGIGGLAVLSAKRKSTTAPAYMYLVSGCVGLGTILAASYWIRNGDNFPGWIALFPVLGTVVALIAGDELPGRGVGILLNSAPLQFLGKLSYSWYLWHWPVLVLTEALKPGIGVIGKLVAAGLSLLLATATHLLIENPIRFHPFLIKRPWWTISMGAALTALSFGTGSASLEIADHQANHPEMKRIMAAVEDVSRMPRGQCVALRNSSDVKICNFGATDPSRHLVLFGDSHAIQWFNPLETIARKRGWRLTTIVKSGCPATDIRPRDTREGYAEACVEWREKAFRLIENIHPDIVLMGSATMNVGNADEGRSQERISTDEWQHGTRRALHRLSGCAEAVAILRDNPLSLVDIPTCLARSVRSDWFPRNSCDMVPESSLNPSVFESEKAAAHSLKNAYLIDMTDQICGDKRCSAIQNDVIIYRDNNHLTGAYADTLHSVLEMRLMSIIRPDLNVLDRN